MNSSPQALRGRYHIVASIVCGLVVTVVVMSVVPKNPLGFTATLYLLLTPYYLVVTARSWRAFWGAARSIPQTVGLGAAVGLMLAGADFLFRAAIFGERHLVHSPAPASVMLAVLTAPLVETVWFQLGIQSRFANPVLRVTVAAALFAAFHLSLNPIFVLAGVALALLQEKTQHPGATAVAHFVYNVLLTQLVTA